MFILRARGSWVLLLAAIGCADHDDGTGSSSTGTTTGDTGIGTASASDSGGASACVETSTVLAFDEPSPLGFSAAELLAGKLGARTTTLVFDDFAGLAAAYRGKTLALDVELRHAGGAVRWIDSMTSPDFPYATEVDPGCEDFLEIDVELDFMTEDGLLAESRAAVLTASSVDVARLEVALLPDLKGSLDPATLYENGWTVSGLLWTGTWAQELAGGKLWSETTDGLFTLATWGDAIAP